MANGSIFVSTYFDICSLRSRLMPYQIPATLIKGNDWRIIVVHGKYIHLVYVTETATTNKLDRKPKKYSKNETNFKKNNEYLTWVNNQQKVLVKVNICNRKVDGGLYTKSSWETVHATFQSACYCSVLFCLLIFNHVFG